ncbi:hypothetical protein D7Y44_00565 [Stenotrophomonas maltophilia]|uniref:hypothetical protein n=2 Tax=Stenotrophomonas maltophilia TaxID=40324 RepID=UPI001E13D8B3|nr:hypothetical protein [Stenotrophomonas maltophilia]MBA0279648.1 hypothetical protein [Stenotrophomonas maltophilia]MBA0343705.1 hypothetical protein [Stenotrophomonas maltophilia]MBA0355944.1 hypothetical protein [Stenotrophomonas maltophilia]MBA0517965.1 hypothetical protein [Stenotrophomonas maltophilia]
MRPRPLLLAALMLGAAGPVSADGAELSDVAAEAIFDEAQMLCQADNGHLWGASLCGPMMLVDRTNRRVTASHADAQGNLQARGKVFVGQLPPDAIIANTAVDWSGTRWTQLLWPLPRDEGRRRTLLAHEMFHRLQPALSIVAPAEGGNEHLDTLEGRYWMQLEWRALAAALSASDPGAQHNAMNDALAFRAERYRRSPAAAQEEAALELNEGLAEYTGVLVGNLTPAARIEATLHDLRAHAGDRSFVRSFAYATGPAYGLLLDQVSPGWHRDLGPLARDLGTLLAEHTGITPSTDASTLRVAAARHGGTALRRLEVQREQQRLALLDRNRARFVTGPVLRLDLRSMRIQFDPGNMQPLPGNGTVYPTMQLSDVWGTLTVTDGALMQNDWKAVFVQAPASGDPPLQGSGWRLSLEPGWKLVPGARRGDYMLLAQP